LTSRRAIAVRELLDSDDEPLDAILISNIINVAYVSGFTGSTAMLLVTPQELLLLTDFRYIAQARRECPDWDIVDISKPAALGQVFSDRLQIKRIGFEATNVTIAQLAGWKKKSEGVEWFEAPTEVSKLRLIKDDGEIALIERAISIAQDSFLLVAPLLAVGTSETEFAIELEFAMRRAGAEAPSFDTIVASGENGSYPHHRPNDRTFQLGDFVTIDWGAKYQGYCSDITRTVVIGSPSPKQQEIYDVVEEAKQLAIQAIAPGKSGVEIDSVARDYIAAKGYGENFGHSLGHSLGRDVHDGNTLSQRAEKVILAPGMVTTVEPGIYIEGFGGVRIEEDVLVTATGSRILTREWSGLT
jgi:Xaa-Pro aminopeptidase